MNTNSIKKLKESFDLIAQIDHDSGVEFWYARDLQKTLGYSEWRNFFKIIDKAKESCSNTGVDSQNHFVDVNKMVDIGSGISRSIDDIMLTRYACYLPN
jgi:DNA-damage-inducible protein D